MLTIETWSDPFATDGEPTQEPVTADDVRLAGKIDKSGDTTIDDTDDAQIGKFITAAREHVESRLNRALLTQTRLLLLDNLNESALVRNEGRVIRLPRAPVQSVTSVKFTDADGDESTISSTLYSEDLQNEPCRIFLKNGVSWGVSSLQAVAAVKIEFVCGWEEAADVPVKIRNWIAQCAAWQFLGPPGEPINLDDYPTGQLEHLRVVL